MRDILARLRKTGDDVPRWEVVPMPAGVEIPGVRRVDADQYWLQMDSWRRRSRADTRRGKIVVEWASRTAKAADHLLDCELLQILAAMIHGRLKLTVDGREPVRLPDPSSEAAPNFDSSDTGKAVSTP
jgi:hypothetical protein